MAPAHADLLRLNDDRRLRNARGDEAAALSALTLRSKAYSNLTEPEAAAPSSLSHNVSPGYMRTTGVFADRQQDHAMMPDRPLHSRVVAVVYDGLCTFEFGCAYEIFCLPRPELDRPWYRFEVCAAEAGPLRAAGGLVVQAPHDLGLIEQADSVIVPGWRGPDEAPPLPLLDALARVPERGGRLVSICSGVFVLAATGVLDGRRATTHWRYAETLAQRYPRIRVDPDVLYVDEGSVLTSAGSAAALDLCLHTRSGFHQVVGVRG